MKADTSEGGRQTGRPRGGIVTKEIVPKESVLQEIVLKIVSTEIVPGWTSQRRKRHCTEGDLYQGRLH